MRFPEKLFLRTVGLSRAVIFLRSFFLRVQKLSIPVSGKSSKANQKMAWLRKHLLLILTSKKEMLIQWVAGRFPGKNVGKRSGYLGLESGKLRNRWNDT